MSQGVELRSDCGHSLLDHRTLCVDCCYMLRRGSNPLATEALLLGLEVPVLQAQVLPTLQQVSGISCNGGLWSGWSGWSGWRRSLHASLWGHQPGSGVHRQDTLLRSRTEPGFASRTSQPSRLRDLPREGDGEALLARDRGNSDSLHGGNGFGDCFLHPREPDVNARKTKLVWPGGQGRARAYVGLLASQDGFGLWGYCLSGGKRLPLGGSRSSLRILTTHDVV